MKDVLEGDRHATLAHYAIAQKVRGRSFNKVLERIVHFNAYYCKPPLPVYEVTQIVHKTVGRRSIVRNDGE